MKIISTLALCLSLFASPSFATGPLGNVPGQPVEALPAYGPPHNKKSVKKGELPDSTIYEALNVVVKNSVKSAGGLSCSKARCTLAARHNARTIYIAMKLPEKNITSALIKGSRTFSRSIGRLFCARTIPNLPRKAANSYSCTLR
jgi:hypothetical protein